MKLVREGHDRAFDALVHRYRPPLLRYCRGLGLSDARAEDAVQLALLNAWLALAGGAEVRDLRPWLYRIAHNGALNALRGPAERHVELTDAVPCAVAHVADDELDRRIAVCDALADVAALPPMQRQAILLTAVAGNTHDETAGALGIGQDAVRGLVYRARATLRSAAAIAPQPLLGWASGGAGTTGGATARMCELSAGGGALGLTGALLKGAAVAITAGALLGGASAVRLHAAHHAHGAGARVPNSGVVPLRGGQESAIGVAASAPAALTTYASVHAVSRGAGPHLLGRAHRPSPTGHERGAPSQDMALGTPGHPSGGPNPLRHDGVTLAIQDAPQRQADGEVPTSSPGEAGDSPAAGTNRSPDEQRTRGAAAPRGHEGEGSGAGGSGAGESEPVEAPAGEAGGEPPHEAAHARPGDSSGSGEAGAVGRRA